MKNWITVNQLIEQLQSLADGNATSADFPVNCITKEGYCQVPFKLNKDAMGNIEMALGYASEKGIAAE